MLVTVSVLDAKSCGAETVPELVTSPHTTLPVDTPPLVAVKVQSRLSQSSGPVEAAPVIVSVAPVSAPVAAKLAAVAAPEAVSVPVDTSPTVVKFPALAVLLMVNVLPVIPVAELSRPTLAAPLMLSELPDTAPVDDSAAPATVPVAVSAAQEMAPEASTPVVNTSVQFTSLHSSWSQPTLPCAVSPSSVAESPEAEPAVGHARHKFHANVEASIPSAPGTQLMMSRITNYEAVSNAFDRRNRSNRVSNQVSHIVAALLPKIPWCGPGAGPLYRER